MDQNPHPVNYNLNAKPEDTPPSEDLKKLGLAQLKHNSNTTLGLMYLMSDFLSNQVTWNFRYFTLDEEGNPEADDPNKLTIDDEDEGFEEFDVDGEVEMDQMDWL